jgi:hypothetical protein
VLHTCPAGQQLVEEQLCTSRAITLHHAKIIASRKSTPYRPAGQQLVEEQLCVWAISSLGGITLSGMPRGSLASSAGAGRGASPKAVLWGRCVRPAGQGPWGPPGVLPPLPGGLLALPGAALGQQGQQGQQLGRPQHGHNLSMGALPGGGAVEAAGWYGGGQLPGCAPGPGGGGGGGGGGALQPVWLHPHEAAVAPDLQYGISACVVFRYPAYVPVGVARGPNK